MWTSLLNWRVAGVAASVLVGAGIGVATNVVTSRWSWTWGAGLVGLILSAVIIQVLLSLNDRRKDSPAPLPGQTPVRTVLGDSRNVVGHGSVSGDNNITNVTTGVSGLHVVLALAVVGLVVLGVVVWAVPGRGVSTAIPQTPSAGLAQSSSDSAEPTPSGGAPGMGPGTYDGALGVTLTTAYSTPSYNFIFPRSQAAKADRYLSGALGDIEDMNVEALSEGAYAVGGLTLIVDLESHIADKITVFNVKPIIKRGPIIDGPLIVLSNEGEDTDQTYFDLDAPAPTAVKVNEDTRAPDGPFFHSRTIILGKGEKDTIMMAFFALTASYTFRISISFEAGGKRYTQVLDHAGQPFRLTPDLCTWLNPYSSPFIDAHAAAMRKAVIPHKPSYVMQRNDFTNLKSVPPDDFLSKPGCRKGF